MKTVGFPIKAKPRATGQPIVFWSPFLKTIHFSEMDGSTQGIAKTFVLQLQMCDKLCLCIAALNIAKLRRDW